MYRLNENFTVNDLVNKWTHKVRHGLKYLLQRRGYMGMSVAYARRLFESASQYVNTRYSEFADDVQF